jgi:hypothetical protein
MKYYILNFIIIVFFAFSCKKETNNTSNITGNNTSTVPEKKSTSLLDTIAMCKWVFTEYHDKVKYQNGTYSMVIISDGDETANIDMNGKIFLTRDYDFSFATMDYFNSPFQPVSFVTSSYAQPYHDTAGYNLVNQSIILSKPVKYLPDSMSIVSVDTACLVLSGILHTKDYDVKRAIVFYKNTRWYGGYRNFGGL